MHLDFEPRYLQGQTKRVTQKTGTARKGEGERVDDNPSGEAHLCNQVRLP
jgi:hypothetical protein